MLTCRAFANPRTGGHCQVGDETVLLNLESGTYFGLDPGQPLSLELRSGRHAGGGPAKMLEEFDVTEVQLEADLLRLADEMLASGFAS